MLVFVFLLCNPKKQIKWQLVDVAKGLACPGNDVIESKSIAKHNDCVFVTFHNSADVYTEYITGSGSVSVSLAL